MKHALQSFLRGAVTVAVIVLVEVLLITTKHYVLCGVFIGAIVVLAGIAQFLAWGSVGRAQPERAGKEFEKISAQLRCAKKEN